jgi:hypothetical protein
MGDTLVEIANFTAAVMEDHVAAFEEVDEAGALVERNAVVDLELKSIKSVRHKSSIVHEDIQQVQPPGTFLPSFTLIHSFNLLVPGYTAIFSQAVP